MLNKVHHVTYVVESISEMATYMERSFGIKPIATDEFADAGFKSILFRIGETLVDFFEPLRDDPTMARLLKATGPGGLQGSATVDSSTGGAILDAVNGKPIGGVKGFLKILQKVRLFLHLYN